MKFVNANYGIDFEFQEGNPEVIIIESPQIMREFVAELWNQCAGMEGNFVLSENKLLKIDKNMEMIINPFEIDFQNRKIINALYAKMSAAANELVEEKNEINVELINILDNVSSLINYSGVVYQLDFLWVELFKMYGVKIDVPEDFRICVMEYMRVISELCNVSIFCFVNLKNYLKREEIIDLYKNAEYNKIKLLMIESNEKAIIDSEHMTIIDNDCCVISKN